MMLTPEQARVATGMKVSEIVDIEAVPGGYRVTTHDGQTIDLEAVEEDSGATVEQAPEGVPGGSVEEVLTWVGDDSQRAVDARLAELDREQPRKSLLDKLAKVAG